MVNRYRSRFEKTIAALFNKFKVKFRYEPFSLKYTIEAKYTPDFVIKSKTGDVLIETKGYFKPSDRRKMIAVKECNPDLDIRLWFMRDTYLSNKTKKTKYSDWATKHSFPYHVGETFPYHWFDF